MKTYHPHQFAEKLGVSVSTLRRWDFEERLVAKRHDCQIVVVNQEILSPQQEMVEDMLAIIHSFSSRLYGLKKHKKQIKDLVKADE